MTHEAVCVFEPAPLSDGSLQNKILPPQKPEMLTLPQGADHAPPEFHQWIVQTYREGRRRGLSHDTLFNALDGLAPDPDIIRLDRSQPELKQTIEQYMDKRVHPNVKRGLAKMREHEGVLVQISNKYGVPPSVIVALWGIETQHGNFKGKTSIIKALSTLAFDGRRRDFFTKELFHAFDILEAGHVALEHFIGSWAGAMGHCQFMPSSFKSYAVDWDGDGRADIWHSEIDAMASIANYLKHAGWKSAETWGRPVMIPEEFDCKYISPKVKKTLKEWQELGVCQLDGTPLPPREIKACIVTPKSDKRQVFMVYDNYKVLLKWNRSDAFAISVGMLADQLRLKHSESRT